MLVGVDGGADALRAAGYKPRLIVGNPERDRHHDTLRGGAEVVIPADIDGHAPGLERLQDLGLGAVTFPATGTTEDLALLLADARDAALIVTVGMHTTLTELLDRSGGSAASTFLVRMRVANKIVEAPAVAQLYKARISWWVRDAPGGRGDRRDRRRTAGLRRVAAPTSISSDSGGTTSSPGSRGFSDDLHAVSHRLAGGDLPGAGAWHRAGRHQDLFADAAGLQCDNDRR